MLDNKKPTDFRKFFSYYKPYKGLLFLDLSAAVLVAALGLLFPLCVRYITTDILQSGSENILRSIMEVGVWMLAIIAVRSVFGLFYDYKGHDMGAKIERDMRNELFFHYQKLPFRFFDNQRTGELMSRLTNDLLNLAELYHHGPEQVLIYSIQFVGAFIILSNINGKLTLVACALLPVLGIYSFVFYRKVQKSYKENNQRIAEINAQTEENLSGIRTAKSFANEEYENKKFSKANQRFYLGRRDIYKKEALHYSMIEYFFTPLISLLIIVCGSVWIADGSLALADLLVFVMYAVYLTEPIPRLSFMVMQYQGGLSGYRRFLEMMHTVPEILDAPEALSLEVTDGKVTFDNVSFRYNEEKEYVLKNIDLDVKDGETVAIVGQSGIGKTTLCSLIPRFYETDAGNILIDGINIREVTQQSLRQKIGVVRQDTFLFSGTVLENILYGDPEASKEKAVEAARKANAHEFIMGLPDGYDTNIGQRGVKLSGGQQQRISIARVFLKNPPILIFDEATSALDYESERMVMSSLKTLSEGRTTFIIAHRLSTVKNADRIVVLANDGIAEQGTHQELYEANGEYTKLYNAQDNSL